MADPLALAVAEPVADPLALAEADPEAEPEADALALAEDELLGPVTGPLATPPRSSSALSGSVRLELPT